MTIEKFPGRFASSNGTRRNQQNALAGNPKDRIRNLKYAIFYLVAAIILFLANRVSTHSAENGNQTESPSNRQIDLSVAPKLEINPKASHGGRAATYIVRFRLTNQGNQPIFYPVFRGTNHPLGQIVYRIAAEGEWKPLSAAELSRSTPSQPNLKADLAWVEMPPGGWADGEYEDAGSPGGDHAFALEIKLAADGKINSLLSRAYPVNSN